ncbi:uncharacterized protein LOC131307687 isoform X2 [Rhododendron vialii]|uniref:uncharacterized protein LOC131307687 isoform X2 n=1 Tax=Rhododendron vialii TaxID=182163 RepID=UPI00265DBCCF|nr:uncharacterized protein LOC131307687 isoform X2 [Rhododendron vialii]
MPSSGRNCLADGGIIILLFQIPNHVAIQIALELKKMLIDDSLLDISQSNLEANLFKVKEKGGETVLPHFRWFRNHNKDTTTTPRLQDARILEQIHHSSKIGSTMVSA